MAALVGGSTGAALAAIVMIFEMTLDYNVIVPMTLTVAIAYGVRRLLFKESIYTFKLARRGHSMPEALETNAHFFRRARDLMDARIAVVSASLTPDGLLQQAQEQPGIEYFLLEGPVGIAGVSRRGCGPTTADFCALDEDLTLPDCLERMHRTGARIAVVSNGGSLESAHIKGIIAKDQLADALAESIERYADE